MLYTYFRNLFAIARHTGLACCALGLTAANLMAEDTWTRFRGANGLGNVPNCTAPLPWDEQSVAWTTGLQGTGNGSPVVYGNHIYLMSASPKTAERYLCCYDLKSGAELWRQPLQTETHHLHTRSSYASCTPCVDDKAVYFTWGSPANVAVAAYTHDGEFIWRRDLGYFASQHGYGASPALFGNLLVLFNSQASEQLPPGVKPGNSRVLALNSETGEDVWTCPIATTRVCYGVPAQFHDSQSGQEALLFSDTGEGMLALSLASGERLWNRKLFTKRCVSSPIVVGDLAFGTEGSGGGGNVLFALNLKSPEHEVVYSVQRSAPYVPTPVARDGLVFLWSDQGIVSCITATDGKVQWTKRIGGNVSSSPVIAGDKLIGVAEDGTVTILSATANFEEIGAVKLGETMRATPLVGASYVLFRTNSKLVCVGTP
ncbi:outer membrane protein assembly factor BamB family protein [Aureliella helgolandensis]|uniref:Serine/threonine-protein kinase AfsK n=1 Tax=Aureliella helgolandensis TaxID=2527968 RepID=A0A518G702_9BACT|nr:PQQ-binding-like beta-propeller repeat protein [Aureliella helgolandensis]QDV24351.1 Serine/threonine-protein kinase AfsK [Aureliella helgolandensis]